MKPSKIIIGQKDSGITNRFGFALKGLDYDVHVAHRADKIMHLVNQLPAPDLVILDGALSRPDPVELCQVMKSDAKLIPIPVMVVLPAEQEKAQVALIQSGCDDVLVDPTPSSFLARVQSLLRLKSIYDQSDDGESVLYTLARTIEAKDRYTLGHADRVSHFAVDLGKAMGVKKTELEILRRGGMLHDIGKIAIPDAILSKPGKYTPEEFSIMKEHPVLGCEICSKLRSVSEALPIIRHHHEKLDGSGYPDKLGGGQIPSLVRIVTIVDIYDALRSKRSYKEAFSIDKSFEIMWDEVEKGWWDKEVLACWEKLVRGNKVGPDQTASSL